MIAVWQQVTDDPDMVIMTHRYPRLAGIPDQQTRNAASLYPWVWKQIRAGSIVKVSSLKELPTEAAVDRENAELSGIKSNISLPLSTGGGLPFGVLALNTTREERSWSDELVMRLQLVTQMFANAIQRKRAEEQLLLTQFAVDQAPEAIFWMTSDARFFYANEAACQSLGYTRQELLAMTVHDVDPDFPPEVWASSWIDLKERKTQQLETLHQRKDGTRFPVEVIARYLTFGDQEYNLAFVRDISDRKHIEQDLYEQKELLAKTQEIAHVGSWLFEPGASRLTWSEETYRMFGLGSQERAVTHDDFINAVHPDDREAVLAAYSHSLQQQHDTYDIEHRIVRKDTGEIRTVREKCLHERDEAGTVLRSIGMVQDITERRLMEGELRNKERMLSSVFRSAPTGIGVVVNRTLMMVNDKVCEISGYRQEELQGQSTRMLYPDEADFLYVGKEKYRQISEKGTGTVETRWRRKDGRIIDILMSSTPINPLDLTAGVTFSALDITERKRAEEALRESQELFAKAFALSPAPMVISDPTTGRFIDANEQWLRMLGHTREETIGRTSYELNIWADPAIREAMANKIKTTGFLQEEPIQFRTKAGTVKDTLWSAVLVTLGGAEVMLSLIYDFTERKRAE
ncbi:MAG: PAS domain S-box protein, partial [Syntrophobacteraceae bacterium]|nr:PAS domain S-box protein [Syntrophobacteraceae bacterium]